MAIIYSYPTVVPTSDDLVLGTDVNGTGQPTKNFTIQSIVDIVQGGATGLGAVLAISSDALQQAATNFTNIQGTGAVTFGSFADGTMNIVNGLGTGFTRIQSTDFAGDLTGIVKVSSSIAGAADGVEASNVTGVTQPVGTSNKTLATTAFVMSKVDPSVLTFNGTSGGDQTVNLAAQTFSLLGTANEIESVSTAQTITFGFPAAGVALPNGSTATTQIPADDSTKIATTAFVRNYDDTQDLDFSGDNSSTGAVLLNSQTLAIAGTANQVVTAANSQTLTISLPTTVIRNLQGNVTGTLLATSSIQGVAGAGSTDAQNVLAVTQAAGDDSTRIATTAYVDAAAGAKTLAYKDTSATVNTMNLVADDLQFTGGSNITSTATAVASNIADIKFDLNDSVTITGTMNADKFETTAGTATWTGTILDGFTSISSTDFDGELDGNAKTATALAVPGTVKLLSGSGATQGVASNAVTYTSGSDIELTTTLANTTVTAKTLQGLPTPAAATVVAADTILEGFGKLQSQINGIANGLQFQGTWNASMDTGGTDNTPGGTPALASGGGEASSGTTDATTANELVDSTKNFTTAPNIVAVGDKVINQADGQEALVTAITNAASGRLELAADIMLTGEAYIIDKTPFITAGHYYVVDAVGATTARNATLNGIQDWQVGDWVIASVTNVWQKLNNSAVEGSGTENRLTKWAAAASTLVDSGIIDNGTTIKLQNDTELGGAAGDAISSVGVHTIDEQLILKKGLGLLLSDGATPPVFSNNYGASGQVLTSAGASSDTPTWTTPTTGTVESVTAGAGIVMTGDAVDPVVNIDYLGADNAILSATALGSTTADQIALTDQIWFNDITVGSGATGTNTLSYAPVQKLKDIINTYSWILSDGTNTTTISDSDTVTFTAAGTGIAVAENNGTITITGSANPGTGTALTLPVWDTTTSLGDSMVKQDAATGTTLTISGLEPSVVIDDTTTGKGSLTISRAADVTTYMSSGTASTYGTHVFSQTDGTTPRAILELDGERRATFNGRVGINKTNNTADVPLVIDTIAGYPDIAQFSSLNSTDTNEDCRIVMFAKGTGTAVITSNTSIDLQKSGSSKLLVSSTGVSVTGTLSTTTSASIGTTLTTGGSITVATHGLLSIPASGGNNLTISGTAVDHAGLSFATQAILPVTVSVENNGVVDLGANGNSFKDLYLSGNVIHGSGGGIFNGDQAITTAVGATLAFTLTRATTGTLIFDVWLTSETSIATSVAKKYVVAHSYNSIPVYNKVIDTGPDGSNDFTVQFIDSAVGATGTSCKCILTATGADQNIGYTVQVGHDSTNALTFTAAS